MMHRCTQCGTQYDVSDRQPGFRFRCATCNSVQIVGVERESPPARRTPVRDRPARGSGQRPSRDREYRAASARSGGKLRLVIAGVVILVVAGLGVLFYAQAQQRKEEHKRRETVDEQFDRLDRAQSASDLESAIRWFDDNPEYQDLVDSGRLNRFREVLKRKRLEDEFEQLRTAAHAAAITDKDAAKEKYRELIAWCESHKGFDDRVTELNQAILKLDPEDVAAHEDLGKVRVELDLQDLASYRPFFPEEVEELSPFVEGQWLYPDKARQAQEVIDENEKPIREFQAAHQDDPRFQRALARIPDVLQEEGFDDDMRAYYRDGCLVFHETGLGRPIERDLAEMNLASMAFARSMFDKFAATVPHKIEHTGEALILVSLKDKKSYLDYNDAEHNPWVEKARAYYRPLNRWITTYNEHIPGRFFNRMMKEMVGTSVHESSHHTRHLHTVGGRRLQPSYQFEEGWAEYTSGCDVKFDRQEHRCHITHTGLNESRLKAYCGEYGRDNQFFPRLSLKELISLHTKFDERRLAEERARQAGQPFAQGWQDSVFGLVYAQGYSFIYFCYEGGEFKYKEQMDEWRAWQWSAACINSQIPGGYVQAWRKFKEIFGDTDKVQEEWWAWEDSLEF